MNKIWLPFGTFYTAFSSPDVLPEHSVMLISTQTCPGIDRLSYKWTDVNGYRLASC